jgi:hypothetical protein
MSSIEELLDAIQTQCLTFLYKLKVAMKVIWDKLTTVYRAGRGLDVAGFVGLMCVRRLTGEYKTGAGDHSQADGRQFASVGLHGYCKLTVH